MGRLIDADALSAFLKDAVIKHKYDRLNIDNTLTVADVLQSVCAELDGTGLDGLKNAPTVDAVPVVRCKDCTEYQQKSLWCHLHYMTMRPTDFCNYGERKDGDADD